MIQGTQEWLEARARHLTGSRAYDMITKRKDGKGYLAGRDAYKTEKICEILTGIPADSFSSYATDWGNEQEPKARQLYEIRTGMLADPAPFIKHATIPYVGASPDALVGEDGIIEIKCPYNMTNHLNTLLYGMPDEHRAQVQFNMWVTGRVWCDFVSHDPRFPEKQQSYVQRIAADPAYHKMLETECAQFWAEVQVALKELEAKAA